MCVRFEFTGSSALALYWFFFRKKLSSEYKGNKSGHTVIANGALLDYQVLCVIRVLLTFSVDAKHGQMLALKRKREQKWIDVSRLAAKRSADTADIKCNLESPSYPSKPLQYIVVCICRNHSSVCQPVSHLVSTSLLL